MMMMMMMWWKKDTVRTQWPHGQLVDWWSAPTLGRLGVVALIGFGGYASMCFCFCVVSSLFDGCHRQCTDHVFAYGRLRTSLISSFDPLLITDWQGQVRSRVIAFPW